MRLTVTIQKNDFPVIASRLASAADTLAEILATQIQAESILNTSRVDTGAMKSGWRIAPLGAGVWIVYNTQSYAIFHEAGTYKLPASPMLVPAVETVLGSLRGGGGQFWSLVL